MRTFSTKNLLLVPLVILIIALVLATATLVYRGILNNRLLYGAERGRIDMVRSSLEGGASPNLVDEGKSTPLMYAAQNEHDDIARLLVEYGANVNAQDEQGYTPLMFATNIDDLSTVRLLCAAGAEVGLKNKSGLTALDYAKERRNQTIIVLLKHR